MFVIQASFLNNIVVHLIFQNMFIEHFDIFSTYSQILFPSWENEKCGYRYTTYIKESVIELYF